MREHLITHVANRLQSRFATLPGSAHIDWRKEAETITEVVQTDAGHAGNLTQAETERLDILQEELAEVILAIAKIKRHGWLAYNHTVVPDTYDNRHAFQKELTDVYAVAQAMWQAGDIDLPTGTQIDAAWAKKMAYTHHQK